MVRFSPCRLQGVYISEKHPDSLVSKFQQSKQSDCANRACRVSQLECEPRSRVRVTHKVFHPPQLAETGGGRNGSSLCVPATLPRPLAPSHPAQHVAGPKFLSDLQNSATSPSGCLPRSQHQSGIKAVEKLTKSPFRPQEAPSNVPISIIGFFRFAQRDQ